MNPIIRFLYPVVALGGPFIILLFSSGFAQKMIACTPKDVVSPIVNTERVAMFEKQLQIRYVAGEKFYSIIFDFKELGDYKFRFSAPDNTRLTKSSYLPRDFDRVMEPYMPGLHIAGGMLPRRLRMEVTHKGKVETHDFYNNLSPLDY